MDGVIRLLGAKPFVELFFSFQLIVTKNVYLCGDFQASIFYGAETHTDTRAKAFAGTTAFSTANVAGKVVGDALD